MGRTLLAHACAVIAFLKRGQPLRKNLIALDGAIEFLLLPNEHVAQFLQAALQMSDAHLKIMQSSRFHRYLIDVQRSTVIVRVRTGGHRECL